MSMVSKKVECNIKLCEWPGSGGGGKGREVRFERAYIET